MSDVIRDVVVRITLEQINTALKVPDLAPIKAEYKDTAKIGTEAFEKPLKSVSDLEIATKAAGLRQRQLNKDIGDAIKEGTKNYEAELKRRADAEDKLAAAAAAAAVKQQAANLKVLDTTKQLGEGVFQLARGIAFLTTSGDEDFRAMLATIAKLQGGFDLIKGGATTIKALVEGTNALKIATGAATIGQALLAGANTVVATTAGVATAAVTALKVALGPIGLIITGIGAAALVAAAAWSFFAKNADSAAESLDKTAESIRRATKETEIQSKYEQANYALHKQVLDSRMAQMTVDEQMAAIGKERANLLKLEADLLQKIIDKRKELNKAQSDLNASKANQQPESGFLAGVFGASGAGAAYKGKDKELIESQKGMQEALNSAKQAEIDLEKQKLGYITEELSGQEKAVALANQKNSAAERELEKEKQIADMAKQGLETAKQKLALEEKKLQSFEAQFGALTKQEQLELKRLSDKAKAGEELNRRELERAEQLGGDATRDFVQAQRAKAGRAAGAADSVSGFSDVTAGVTQAGLEIQSKATELAEAQAGVANAQREVTEAMQVVNANRVLLESIRQIFEAQGKMINDMQKDLDTNNAQNI